MALSPVDSNPGGTSVVRGYINISTGAGTSAVVIKVKQGSATTGTLVGTADTVAVSASTAYSIPFCQVVPAGGTISYPGNQYCVTVTQTGATGNGTVNDAAIEFASIGTVG